jgi:hypothetical protein
MYVRKYNPHGAGAKGRWRPEFEKQTYKLALLGATEKEIADFFEVDTTTITYWKQTNPVFATALKRGRIEADMNVAHSYYKLANGFTHPDIHILSNRVRTFNMDTREVTERTEALVIPIIKYFPPNPFAAQKWLQVRQRDKWADVQQSKVNIIMEGQVDVNLLQENLSDPKQYSTEELEWALKLGLTQGANTNVSRN